MNHHTNPHLAERNSLTVAGANAGPVVALASAVMAFDDDASATGPIGPGWDKWHCMIAIAIGPGQRGTFVA